MSEVLLVDINIYLPNGYLVSTSRPEIFQNGFDGLLINPHALDAIGREGTMSYILSERIGDLEYMSAYMPLILDNGKTYILNVPYFAQNDELNVDILIMIIITVNIAIIMMVLAFILSSKLERYFRQGISYAHGSYKEFFTRPISCVLLIISLVCLVWPLISDILKSKKNPTETMENTIQANDD